MTFFSDAQGLGKFKRLKKELSSLPLTYEQAAMDFFDEMDGKRRSKSDALEEFAALLFSREGIAEVLRRHGYAGPAGKAKLVDLYWDLSKAGAGQLVGTTYVPTAALYDPDLLARLLKAQADGASPPALAVIALNYCAATEEIARVRRLEKRKVNRAQLALVVPIFVASVAVISYLQRPNTLSVLAVFGAIVLAFRVLMAVIPRKAKVTAAGTEREIGGFASLFALWYPIFAISWAGGYASVPWTDMLSYGLAQLGYILGAAALVAGHFDILGLHSRLATFCAAIGFFAAGIVLANSTGFLNMFSFASPMSSWLTFSTVVVTAFLLRLLFIFLFSTRGQFWRLVANRPDIALAVFRDHPSCIVDDSPPERHKYTGPFSFMDSSGQKHKVYILFEHIEEVQAQCADKINGVARRHQDFGPSDREPTKKPSARRAPRWEEPAHIALCEEAALHKMWPAYYRLRRWADMDGQENLLGTAVRELSRREGRLSVERHEIVLAGNGGVMVEEREG